MCGTLQVIPAKLALLDTGVEEAVWKALGDAGRELWLCAFGALEGFPKVEIHKLQAGIMGRYHAYWAGLLAADSSALVGGLPVLPRTCKLTGRVNGNEVPGMSSWTAAAGIPGILMAPLRQCSLTAHTWHLVRR